MGQKCEYQLTANSPEPPHQQVPTHLILPKLCRRMKSLVCAQQCERPSLNKLLQSEASCIPFSTPALNSPRNTFQQAAGPSHPKMH